MEVSMKEQHRWTKELATTEFVFKDSGSEGIVVWENRDRLILKAGAKLNPHPELKKDGSLGFSALVAEKLRDDKKDYIKDLVTTKDLVFSSPNQLGLFLRYGGANTWLSLKDKHGKTLHEYSAVN